MLPVVESRRKAPAWLIIARKELRELVRDGRFAVAALSMLLLLTAAVAVGWQDHARSVEYRAMLQDRTRAQWEAQPARNPHGAAHFGMYAIKPAAPLSFLDRGVEPYVGTATYLEAHYQNPFRYRPAEETTGLARMGQLTAASVLQLFLPLLISVMLFSSFAGERESGTMRQLLSLGVSRMTLFAGKAAAALVTLSLVLIPATMLGALALVLSSNDGAEFTRARLLLMLPGYLLYFLFFTILALTISALAATKRSALLVLLAFWVWNGFLAPVFASDLAERMNPVPGAQDFWQAVRTDIEQGLDGHAPRSQRYAAFVERTLRQYGVQRAEDLPVNIAGLAYLESEAYSDGVLDRHYSALWTILEQQAAVHRTVALTAPLLAVRAWSMSAAGTDLMHHRAFADAAEQYRRLVNRQMNENLAYKSRSNDLFYRAAPELWAALPVFHSQLPPVAHVARTHVWDLAVLIGLATLVLAASPMVARRLRP